MDASAEFCNFGTDFPQHQYEPVGADVRLCEGDDAFVDAEADHVLEDRFAKSIAAPRVQFPVAEGSRAAFAKEHVAVRVEFPIDDESPDVAEPLFNVFPLLVEVN